MRFQRDWLHRVLAVPYVPALGPVHPEALSVELFEDAVNASADGRCLPHDKDLRWAPSKDERVLLESIVHWPEQTLIPSITRRGTGAVRLYHYSTDSPDLRPLTETAAKLAAEHGVARAHLVWFEPPGTPQQETSGVRIWLKTFAGSPTAPETSIRNLESAPDAVQASFAAFARAQAADGFGFLHRRLLEGHRDGPLLVALDGQQVVGAIGPMAITPDSQGNDRLLPQYFAVLPDHRGQGHGRALWNAAMRWGQRHGAWYQLLQTEIGGASDRLCRTDALQDLGYVYRLRA